ncbi:MULTISPECIES: sulfurtransferase TusA family protein [unclassified Neorhizobium]|uniref:sulfurtransferase TusA family protein n=1 Tax=unclassified Neorhizobium TaxID=2629175 RepID=UPI00104A8D2D|nr:MULTISPECIES: sulfurtransferase TusA family protein [unclassified Neorhizobium]
MSVATEGLYDLRGLKCPLPVLKTRRRLKEMHSGTELLIETTDPLAGIDIPHFCSQEGHQIIRSEKTETGHRFLIRKG